jgi:hypothetical protein
VGTIEQRDLPHVRQERPDGKCTLAVLNDLMRAQHGEGVLVPPFYQGTNRV